MTVLRSRLDSGSAEHQANVAAMQALWDEVAEQLASVPSVGGQRYVDRHRRRGKMLVRERIEALIDPHTPFLELSPLAAWGTEDPVGAGVPGTQVPTVEPVPGPAGHVPGGPTTRAPLGSIVGARSGDKGGDANVGVFVRDDQAWPWLDGLLTTDRFQTLLPETADLVVDRHPLPNLRAINFVVSGLLQEGVAASTRNDAQAKSLGEWLRARVVDVPEALLD